MFITAFSKQRLFLSSAKVYQQRGWALGTSWHSITFLLHWKTFTVPSASSSLLQTKAKQPKEHGSSCFSLCKTNEEFGFVKNWRFSWYLTAQTGNAIRQKGHAALLIAEQWPNILWKLQNRWVTECDCHHFGQGGPQAGSLCVGGGGPFTANTTSTWLQQWMRWTVDKLPQFHSGDIFGQTFDKFQHLSSQFKNVHRLLWEREEESNTHHVVVPWTVRLAVAVAGG